jgi:hypothetical protein
MVSTLPPAAFTRSLSSFLKGVWSMDRCSARTLVEYSSRRAITARESPTLFTYSLSFFTMTVMAVVPDSWESKLRW